MENKAKENTTSVRTFLTTCEHFDLVRIQFTRVRSDEYFCTYKDHLTRSDRPRLVITTTRWLACPLSPRLFGYPKPSKVQYMYRAPDSLLLLTFREKEKQIGEEKLLGHSVLCPKSIIQLRHGDFPYVLAVLLHGIAPSGPPSEVKTQVHLFLFC